MTDPYVYPGTSVLANRFGIRDPDQLLELERQITAWRMASLHPVPISLDGYRSIHQHVFQDLYDWAGDFRKINLAKATEEAEAVEFLPGPFVEINMQRVFAELEADSRLHGLDRDTFAFRAAVYVADLNHIGNYHLDVVGGASRG